MSGCPSRKQVGGRAMIAASMSPARQLDARGQRQLDFLLATRCVGAGLKPLDLVQLHADLVVQPAAHVDGGRMGPLGRSDPLAAQILGGRDAAALVDVDGTEAKHARADHRQPDDVGVVTCHLGRELRDREFGDVPLAVCREAGEDLVVAQDRPGVLDALCGDRARPEVAEVVVVGRRDAQAKFPHSRPLMQTLVWYDS